MGKGADGCGDSMSIGAPGMEEILTQEAIRSVLDFKQERIMTHTVNPKAIPNGWGLAPGFEYYPSAVGGATARWQVLVPYLLETYPEDFQLIDSGGVGVQEDGSAIMETPGSQFLGVRTVYPFDHPRSGQATDGLLTVHNWAKGDGVQGELKEKLDRALEEYRVNHFRELVAIRSRRAFGDMYTYGNRMIDDLPEDWEQQMCNAMLNMPPMVWMDNQGFHNVGGNGAQSQQSRIPGFTNSWQGAPITKPVHEWNYNDDNQYVTGPRLQAAAAWCGFLKGCEPPMAIVPNLVYQERSVSVVKDEETGNLRNVRGKQQSALNVPVEQAKEKLQKHGLKVETKGEGGFVIGQEPPVLGEADAIKPGSTVILQLGKHDDWRRNYIDEYLD